MKQSRNQQKKIKYNQKLVQLISTQTYQENSKKTQIALLEVREVTDTMEFTD